VTGRYGPNSPQVDRFLELLAAVPGRDWVREADISTSLSPSDAERAKAFHQWRDAERVAPEGRWLKELIAPMPAPDIKGQLEGLTRIGLAMAAMYRTANEWGFEDAIAAVEAAVEAAAGARFKDEANPDRRIVYAPVLAGQALVCRQVLDTKSFEALYELFAKVIPLESLEDNSRLDKPKGK
jgi:hypothetical protein